MKRPSWLPAAIVVLAAASGAAWWFTRSADDAPKFRTAKIEQGELQAIVAAGGTVNPVRQVSVGSQVSGQIKELFADFNTEVKAGQLIARIDPESIAYRVRQAQADLDAARAQALQAEAGIVAAQAAVSRARLDADNAERDRVRKQELLERQFISPAEFEAVRNLAGTLAEQLKVTQAQVEVSRAQAASANATVQQRAAVLAQAKVDLDRTEIRSPVSGVVIKRSVDVGQTVAASLQAPELFIIARNLSDMQVEATIDEADIGRVKTGQTASFTVDAFPARRFEGQVDTVRKAAVSTNNVVTYTVVIAFNTGGVNGGVQLLPGMTANARIVTDTRPNALKLPNAALRVRLPGVTDASASNAASTGDAAVPSGRGSPALQAFREGLAGAVGLSADQLQKADAIIDALRPRFAALRELPEDERAKAAERVRGDLRAQIAPLITPEQKPKFEQLLADSANRAAGSSRGRVYLLGTDGKPQPVAVRLGISDGSMTELLGGSLEAGQSVIVGLTAPASTAAPRAGPAGPRPPF